MNKLDIFNQSQVKKELPDIRPGDTIRVWQKIKEAGKERLQAFEGILIARKHGKGPSATITVRKESFGVGVERIYPLHSPTIEKIELVSRGRARRAKLYYLRQRVGKKSKLKRKELTEEAIKKVAGVYKEEKDAEKEENTKQKTKKS